MKKRYIPKSVCSRKAPKRHTQGNDRQPKEHHHCFNFHNQKVCIFVERFSVRRCQGHTQRKNRGNKTSLGGRMTSLRIYKARSNFLNGTIPSQLSNIRTMTGFGVFGNTVISGMSSTIPTLDSAYIGNLNSADERWSFRTDDHSKVSKQPNRRNSTR